MNVSVDGRHLVIRRITRGIKMLSEHAKQVNNLLVNFRGEIITLRQAVSGGVVKPYMDCGTDEVVFLEVDPSRVVKTDMRVMLSKL